MIPGRAAEYERMAGRKVVEARAGEDMKERSGWRIGDEPAPVVPDLEYTASWAEQLK